MSSEPAVSRGTPDPSAEASVDDARARAAVLARYPGAGDALTRYAELLSGAGVERGLLGPREAQRVWSRHVANSAVLEELVPAAVRVVDVGSGAGLPGVPLALVRPDLRVLLLEPLLRRASFLSEVLTELDLADRVGVLRGRAEDQRAPVADVVTARAVAPLDRLAGWALPLVPVGGTLLALKGTSAQDEVSASAAAVHRLGGGPPVVLRCGVGVVDPPTTVVRVERTGAAR